MSYERLESTEDSSKEGSSQPEYSHVFKKEDLENSESLSVQESLRLISIEVESAFYRDLPRDYITYKEGLEQCYQSKFQKTFPTLSKDEISEEFYLNLIELVQDEERRIKFTEVYSEKYPDEKLDHLSDKQHHPNWAKLVKPTLNLTFSDEDDQEYQQIIEAINQNFSYLLLLPLRDFFVKNTGQFFSLDVAIAKKDKKPEQKQLLYRIGDEFYFAVIIKIETLGEPNGQKYSFPGTVAGFFKFNQETSMFEVDRVIVKSTNKEFVDLNKLIFLQNEITELPAYETILLNQNAKGKPFISHEVDINKRAAENYLHLKEFYQFNDEELKHLEKATGVDTTLLKITRNLPSVEVLERKYKQGQYSFYSEKKKLCVDLLKKEINQIEKKKKLSHKEKKRLKDLRFFCEELKKSDSLSPNIYIAACDLYLKVVRQRQSQSATSYVKWINPAYWFNWIFSNKEWNLIIRYIENRRAHYQALLMMVTDNPSQEITFRKTPLVEPGCLREMKTYDSKWQGGLKALAKLAETYQNKASQIKKKLSFNVENHLTSTSEYLPFYGYAYDESYQLPGYQASRRSGSIGKGIVPMNKAPRINGHDIISEALEAAGLPGFLQREIDLLNVFIDANIAVRNVVKLPEDQDVLGVIVNNNEGSLKVTLEKLRQALRSTSSSELKEVDHLSQVILCSIDTLIKEIAKEKQGKNKQVLGKELQGHLNELCDRLDRLPLTSFLRSKTKAPRYIQPDHSQWKDSTLGLVTDEIDNEEPEARLVKMSAKRAVVGMSLSTINAKKRDEFAQHIFNSTKDYLNYLTDQEKVIDDQCRGMEVTVSKHALKPAELLEKLNERICTNRIIFFGSYHNVIQMSATLPEDSKRAYPTMTVFKGQINDFHHNACRQRDYLDVFIKQLESSQQKYEELKRQPASAMTKKVKIDLDITMRQLWLRSMSQHPSFKRIDKGETRCQKLLELARLERQQVNDMIFQLRNVKRAGKLIIGQGMTNLPSPKNSLS